MRNMWYQRLPLTKEVNERILTDKVRRRARIGRNHWDTSFDMIPDDLPLDKQGRTYKKRLYDYCRTLEQWEPMGIGWVLYGGFGTGKTALGSLILKYCLAKGGRALSFRYADLLDRLMSFKPQFAPNGAPLDIALTNVNYLLIDDLEVEDGERSRKLETVVRRRYDERLPTIITSNESIELLGKIDWLRDMVKLSFKTGDINGVNWRQDPPSHPSSGSIL